MCSCVLHGIQKCVERVIGVCVEVVPVGAAGVGFGEVLAQPLLRGGLRDAVGIGVVLAGDVAQSVQDAQFGGRRRRRCR